MRCIVLILGAMCLSLWGPAAGAEMEVLELQVGETLSLIHI